MDGVKTVPNEELHSFITKIYVQQNKEKSWTWTVYIMHIPIQIARHLQLKKGDKVLVAIKKATPQEIQEYKQR